MDQHEGYVAVTGGAAGLGRVIAEDLLGRGRRVAVVDRDYAAAQATARRLGAGVPVLTADLGTQTGIQTAAGALSDLPVGGLVNNAGGWLPGPQYPEAAADAWLGAVTLNLLAPMLLTQLLWSRLAAVGGAVVNIGSSGGVGDEPYESPEYGAAKAGIARFTASLGSRTDVRVTAVIPGWIGLPRAHREWAMLPAEEQRRIGPLIAPERIAAEVAGLLADGRPGEVRYLLRGDGEESTSRPR